MSINSIASNYHQLLASIREQERLYQRVTGSVKLLAVSKTHGPAMVREAWSAGARDFGENYVQEALAKIAELSAPQSSTPGIIWHFIGPIQSNKTRDIAAHFAWVHSVDRLKIIQRLQDQRPVELAPLNVCIQINLSNEDTKSGVDLQQARDLCAAVAHMDRLCLRGLMAIPAPCADHQLQRDAFRPLADLFREMQTLYPRMDTLSMGMSDDYAAAIAEGSTMIRIGTGIFGKREYAGEQS
ncbi:MAG: YggS family pyridoxal phosphate-dependent enzyme [Pseudohongiella sp.]|nr:YggS family pyridoxal phosphate-dependent enzyme [Pseudohongiella sp.]